MIRVGKFGWTQHPDISDALTGPALFVIKADDPPGEKEAKIQRFLAMFPAPENRARVQGILGDPEGNGRGA